MILMRMFMVRIQQVELSSEVEKVYFFTFYNSIYNRLLINIL